MGVEFFRYFVFDDPSWDYSRYALSGWERDTERIAPFLDATSTDLSAFKARNGKLIIWHGWSDPAITALASVDNYTQVESKDLAVRSYFRLFMLPGVLHCGGGVGPAVVDWFGAIADWVERGLAPSLPPRSTTAGRRFERVPFAPIRSVRSTPVKAARMTRATSSVGRRERI